MFRTRFKNNGRKKGSIYCKWSSIKKIFLNKKFPGITEYVANKTNSKEPVMLIYNNNLSVSPLTTHIPIKNVYKYVKKKNN